MLHFWTFFTPGLLISVFHQWTGNLKYFIKLKINYRWGGQPAIGTWFLFLMTIDLREVFQKIAKLGHLESFKTHLFFGEKGGVPLFFARIFRGGGKGEKLCEIFHTFFFEDLCNLSLCFAPAWTWSTLNTT